MDPVRRVKFKKPDHSLQLAGRRFTGLELSFRPIPSLTAFLYIVTCWYFASKTAPTEEAMEGQGFCNFVRGGCALESEPLLNYSSASPDHYLHYTLPAEGESVSHTHANYFSSLDSINKTAKAIFSELKKLNMPFNNSYIANTFSGGSRTSKDSNRRDSTEPGTASGNDGKYKRDRHDASLNSSNNESFVGDPNPKELKGKRGDGARTRRKSSKAVEGRSEPVKIDLDDLERQERELLEEPEALFALPLKQSTPVGLVDGGFSLDDTMVSPPENFEEVAVHMRKQLENDLNLFDEEELRKNTESADNQARTHMQTQQLRDPVVNLVISKPSAVQSTSKSNYSCKKNRTLSSTSFFLLGVHDSHDSDTEFLIPPKQFQSYPAYLARMNSNDEVKKILETRVKRDTEFPYKVGIQSGTYQQGRVEDMITIDEKDVIGRCIAKGLEFRNKQDGDKVVLNEQMRLSSGIVVINCKDRASAAWLIEIVNKDNLLKMADKIGTPFRNNFKLVAHDIKASNLFMAFSITNNNKNDTWEDTIKYIKARDEASKKQGEEVVNIEDWLLLNTRIDRNQLFTFIDVKRKLHNSFDGGKNGRRIRNFSALGTNINLRWTYGEDENGKKGTTDSRTFSLDGSFFLFKRKASWQHKQPRCQERAWLKRWTRLPRSLTGVKRPRLRREGRRRLSISYTATTTFCKRRFSLTLGIFRIKFNITELLSCPSIDPSFFPNLNRHEGCHGLAPQTELIRLKIIIQELTPRIYTLSSDSCTHGADIKRPRSLTLIYLQPNHRRILHPLLKTPCMAIAFFSLPRFSNVSRKQIQ